IDGLRYKIRHEFGLKGRLYWLLDRVPQCSSLYHLIFPLYINDITQAVQHPIQCGMFADDVVFEHIFIPVIKLKWETNYYHTIYYIQKEEQSQVSKDEQSDYVNYLGLIVDSQVPSLEYACAFWNDAADCHKRRLERIQRISMSNCVRLSEKFPDHDLTLGYRIWKLAWKIDHIGINSKLQSFHIRITHHL
ncbi:hypothetical protein RFI_26669, partial [Reticulomyxa filosa]